MAHLICKAGRLKTSTLITRDADDFRVPLGESLTAFKILDRRHVPEHLIEFTDTGYWSRRGDDFRQKMIEFSNWLKLYLYHIFKGLYFYGLYKMVYGKFRN
jgi:dipeptidyl aminopeptidase/acylaminoacyl peptidase